MVSDRSYWVKQHIFDVNYHLQALKELFGETGLLPGRVGPCAFMKRYEFYLIDYLFDCLRQCKPATALKILLPLLRRPDNHCVIIPSILFEYLRNSKKKEYAPLKKVCEILANYSHNPYKDLLLLGESYNELVNTKIVDIFAFYEKLESRINYITQSNFYSLELKCLCGAVGTFICRAYAIHSSKPWISEEMFTLAPPSVALEETTDLSISNIASYEGVKSIMANYDAENIMKRLAAKSLNNLENIFVLGEVHLPYFDAYFKLALYTKHFTKRNKLLSFLKAKYNSCQSLVLKNYYLRYMLKLSKNSALLILEEYLKCDHTCDLVNYLLDDERLENYKTFLLKLYFKRTELYVNRNNIADLKTIRALIPHFQNSTDELDNVYTYHKSTFLAYINNSKVARISSKSLRIRKSINKKILALI